MFVSCNILFQCSLLLLSYHHQMETRCRNMGYYFRLTARVLLYVPSHRQDSTYHGLCYTSRGALTDTRNSSMGPIHERSIRRTMSERFYHGATSRCQTKKKSRHVQVQVLYLFKFHTLSTRCRPFPFFLR